MEFESPTTTDEVNGVANWYCYGKAVAEQAAWEEAKQRGVDLVAINPVLVLGPLLQPTINASIVHILKYFTGSAKTYANSVATFVLRTRFTVGRSSKFWPTPLSKPSLAAVVGCMMPMMLGVCFLCPSMDCLWHKFHYCPSCNQKVADFEKQDPCIVMDPPHWTEQSFALPV